MKLFSGTKKSSKAHSSHEDDQGSSNASSRSPKKPSSSKSPSKRSTRTHSPGSRKEKEAKDGKLPRSSRSFTRQSSDQSFSASSSRRGAKYDLNTHPLNLPPEERKRFSNLSNMAEPTSPMEIDDPVAVSASSPPPSSPLPTPQPGSQASFSVPVPNGMRDTSTSNGPEAGEDAPPVPPPHRSSPTSPGPSTTERAEVCKAEGNKAFKEKNYSDAIKHYGQAIELCPNEATYLSNRAAAYMSNHQYELALKDCNRAADLDAQNQKVLTRLARIYVFLGLPEDALVTFGRIQPPPSTKDTAPAKEMLQHVQAAQNALRGETKGSMVLHALNQAERGLGAMVAKPRKWQLMRGEAYLKIGDVNALGEAQNTAMALLRQNSQDPEALVLRGRILYAQGENEKALQHFRKALSCDPDFKDAVKYLRIVQKLDRMKEEGNKEYKAGRYDSAIKLYTEALEIDASNRGTNSKLLQNRALCRTKLKQYDDAIADCDRAFSLDPTYVKARKTKAKALGLAGSWEECGREWKAIQELEPEDRSIQKEIRNAELELKKAQRKDYYKILGVEKDADDNAIKKAYRRLAIVHHPDKNAGDPNAEERFKEISEAYDTLSDPQKRAHYDNGDDLVDMSDMFGGGGGMGGMGGGGMSIDPEILFNMMGGGGGGGAFGGGHGGFGGFPRGGGGGPSFSFPTDGAGGRQRRPGGFSGTNFNFNN